ncbi:MAG: hypothetical protein ABI120_23400 [Gemmatimonadaceae bacterium]
MKPRQASGRAHGDNQAEDLISEHTFLQNFDDWVHTFGGFVAANGKVP